MNLQKNPKSGNLKSQVHFSDDYMNFMYRAVKLYGIITNGEHLTDTELMWFICFVYIHNKGVKNHLSEDALQIYKKLINYSGTKANVSNYLKRVKDKGWFEIVDEQIIMPEFFSKMELNKDQILDFEIRLTMKSK